MNHRPIIGLALGLALVVESVSRVRAGGEEPAVEPPDFGWAELHAVLSVYVDAQGLVDYRGLKANRQPLDGYVRALAVLDRSQYEAWPVPQQLAFWINAYNALTLQTIIDHYPIRSGGLMASIRFPRNSIRQIDGVWDSITHRVMGNAMTLDAIEHEVLRKQFRDPRIHMAINCASMGCPPLRREPYVGARLDEQLEDQARRFFANPEKFRIDRARGTVWLSPILKWFGQDFATRYATPAFDGAPDALRPVLHFAALHVSEADAAYLRTARYAVAWLDYDWSLNEQR